MSHHVTLVSHISVSYSEYAYAAPVPNRFYLIINRSGAFDGFYNCVMVSVTVIMVIADMVPVSRKDSQVIKPIVIVVSILMMNYMLRRKGDVSRHHGARYALAALFVGAVGLTCVKVRLVAFTVAKVIMLCLDSFSGASNGCAACRA